MMMVIIFLKFFIVDTFVAVILLSLLVCPLRAYGKKHSNCVTFILAGMITVTGLVTMVFLSLAGTQETMAKIITTTQREKLNLRLY